jgi:hypothetical protein
VQLRIVQVRTVVRDRLPPSGRGVTVAGVRVLPAHRILGIPYALVGGAAGDKPVSPRDVRLIGGTGVRHLRLVMGNGRFVLGSGLLFLGGCRLVPGHGQLLIRLLWCLLR